MMNLPQMCRRSSMETGLNLAMTQLTINNGYVPNAKD